MPGGGPTPIPASLHGVDTHEPVYGLPALWIDKREKELAELAGYTTVDPSSVLTTHLSETIRAHAAELLTRPELQKLLDHLAKESPAIVQEVGQDSLGIHWCRGYCRIFYANGYRFETST